MPKDTPQIIKVRQESKTILVVADISLVTEIPANLKIPIKTWKILFLEIEAARLLFQITYHSATKSRG